VTDLATQLLTSASCGIFYDILHFSGHCDEKRHLVNHLCNELYQQHGDEVFHQFKNNKICMEGLHTISNKILALLQSDLQDLQGAINEEHPDERKSVARDPKQEKRSVSCPPSGYHKMPLPNDTQLIIESRLPNNQLLVLNEDRFVVSLPCHPKSSSYEISLSKSQILNAGVGSLAFENENGLGINFVKANAFASLLSPYAMNMSCILLNSCDSGIIANQVVAQGISLGICSRSLLSDKHALVFSRGFYEALASGYSIEKAYTEGQTRIHLHDRSSLPTQDIGGFIVPAKKVEDHELGKIYIVRSNRPNVLNPSPHPELSMAQLEIGSLESLIDTGMGMLKSKDSELERLRKEN